MASPGGAEHWGSGPGCAPRSRVHAATPCRRSVSAPHLRTVLARAGPADRADQSFR
jgi:hypothetical protein